MKENASTRKSTRSTRKPARSVRKPARSSPKPARSSPKPAPATPKRAPSVLRRKIEEEMGVIRQQLEASDLDRLARRTGFLKRKPRKIQMLQWVLALVALAAETVLSLERVARVVGLAAGVSYTKQALWQRLSPAVEPFLAAVATFLFTRLSLPVQQQGWFKSFGRVIDQDSTVEAVPDKLAAFFPGAANQHAKGTASLKIQFAYDLLHSEVIYLSLSGFRRNDQAASADILARARKGDLILRDLGYFSLEVFARLRAMGAFFLSRYRSDVGVYDPQTHRLLSWKTLLRSGAGVDRDVLLGKAGVPARLVAVPVPDAVANERRRKARQNRDRRLKPSRERLRLLGYNIFVTNVPVETWPTEALQAIYRLRWRIEIIFKAWKSHLRLRELNCTTEALLRLSVMTKLLFCVAVCRFCDSLELLGYDQRHVSLLRLARILGQCACWFAATFLGLTLEEWLDWYLDHQVFYEKRKDRKNFYELFMDSSIGLA